MLRILIADDDLLFQNRLTAILNQHPERYQVSAQVNDGQTAMRRLEELSPDVLLLDMEMPRASGVQVARFAGQLKRKPSILALSNYDSYEYVRPLLRMGAVDYLLKHELSPSLLLEKLEGIAQQRQKEQRLSRQSMEMSLMSRRNFLHRLLEEGQGPPEAPLPAVWEEFQPGPHAVVCMQLVNFLLLYQNDREAGHRRLLTSVLDLCTSILSNLGNGLAVHLQHGEFCLLFRFPQESSIQRIRKDTASYMELIRKNLQKLLGVNMMYAMAPFHGDMGRLPAVWEAARRQLGQQATNSSHRAGEELSLDQERRLMNALCRRDQAGVMGMLEEILAQTPPGDGQGLEYLGSGLLRMLRRYLETQVTPAECTGLLKEMKALFQNPLSTGELKRSLREYYGKAMRLAGESARAELPASIQNALAYIHAHYQEDISLAEVAGSCGISEVYLSKRFKSEPGTSFVSYVNGLRIEAAKELLDHPALSLRDIAEKTGFRNYNYFIKVFKDVTGVTPMHYRETAGQRA